MRRNEREIKDMQDIVSVIEGCQVMRLAIPDEPAPYLVPLNFGFERTEQGVTFYFHSAVAGRKVELLHRQPTVGFELDRLIQIVEKETPCGWTARYESVIGTARPEEITDLEGKRHGLGRIMDHYGWDGEGTFPEAMLLRTSVWKLEVLELTGKRNA